MLNRYILIIIFLLFISALALPGQFSQWRGPARNGIYPETGLLKRWPANGPDLLWSFEGLGAGHGNALMTYDISEK